jgi:hypothetical protein
MMVFRVAAIPVAVDMTFVGREITSTHSLLEQAGWREYCGIVPLVVLVCLCACSTATPHTKY